MFSLSINTKDLGIKLYIIAILINVVPLGIVVLSIILTNVLGCVEGGCSIFGINIDEILGGVSVWMLSLLFIAPFIGVGLAIIGAIIRVVQDRKHL